MDYNGRLRSDLKRTVTIRDMMNYQGVEENKQAQLPTTQGHALVNRAVSNYYMDHAITSQPYTNNALSPASNAPHLQTQHISNAAHLQALHIYPHVQPHEIHHLSSGHFIGHLDEVRIAPSSQERTLKMDAPLNRKEPASLMLVSSGASTSQDASVTASEMERQKAKIIAHPYFSQLLLSYTNCHKIGAPPEAVTELDEICKEYQSFTSTTTTTAFDIDPELDQFMHAYCDQLQNYHEQLTESFLGAETFLKRMEIQLNALTKDDKTTFETARENMERIEPSDDDEEDGSYCEFRSEALAEDNQQIKEALLRTYGGYMICSLKKEFLKSKKRTKLPKEARQKLIDWWTQHYKWPYPSDNEKASLAKVTGLDPKQINNWFINQRKRHWKPDENM